MIPERVRKEGRANRVRCSRETEIEEEQGLRHANGEARGKEYPRAGRRLGVGFVGFFSVVQKDEGRVSLGLRGDKEGEGER